MEKKLSRSEFVFFVAYALWLLIAVIKLTYLKSLLPFATIKDYVEKITVLLLLIKFIDDDKYGLKGIFGIFIVGVLYYVSIQAQAPGIMIPIYFVFSARNVDYRAIFKVTIAIQLLVMTTSVLCSLTGIIPNEVWDAETRGRYSLGYTFCTYGSHIAFFITLMYMSLRKKLRFLEVIGLLAFNFVWFEATNTRIDLLLCIPAIVGCYALGKLKIEIRDNWFYRIVFMGAGPVIAGGAIAAQWFYVNENAIFSKINTALNGRLYYGNQALHEYGITFLGQYIKWIGRGGVKKNPGWVYNYVDCSYVKYLTHYGLFFLVILLLGIALMANKVIKEKNIGLCVAFLFWLLYGAIDAELFELAFQPFMLMLGCAIYEKWGEHSRERRRISGGIHVY